MRRGKNNKRKSSSNAGFFPSASSACLPEPPLLVIQTAGDGSPRRPAAAASPRTHCLHFAPEHGREKCRAKIPSGVQCAADLSAPLHSMKICFSTYLLPNDTDQALRHSSEIEVKHFRSTPFVEKNMTPSQQAISLTKSNGVKYSFQHFVNWNKKNFFWLLFAILLSKSSSLNAGRNLEHFRYEESSSSRRPSPQAPNYSSVSNNSTDVSSEGLSWSDASPFIFSSMAFPDATSLPTPATLDILATTDLRTKTYENNSQPTTFLPVEIETFSPTSSLYFEAMESTSPREISSGDYNSGWLPDDRIALSDVTSSSSEFRRSTIDVNSASQSLDSRSMSSSHVPSSFPQMERIRASQISTVSVDNYLNTRQDGMLQPVSFPRPVYDPYNATDSHAQDAIQESVFATSHPTRTDYDGGDIVVGRRCSASVEGFVRWNDTDGGMLALKSCPSDYQGNAYRPCYTSGKWGKVDYSECRLEYLGRMRHMVGYHIHKGLLGSLHRLAEEFSQYLTTVDMKSPLDRLEAFDILNTLLNVNMNLRLDKHSDVNYVQALLQSSDELLTRKNVFFSSESDKNNLITRKAAELVFDLTLFAERALRGLLKTKKKQIAFRSARNVLLYLYRGKFNRNGIQSKINTSVEYGHDGEPAAAINLEETLEKSAYALMWIRGFREIFSCEELIVNSDIAVATILSPSDRLNRLRHPPTFDIGLRMKKENEDDSYTQECGLLLNASLLWNTQDCYIEARRGDIITCRCRHLGSIALLLRKKDENEKYHPTTAHVGKLIILSCVACLVAVMLTFVINIFHYRREPPNSSLILLNLLISMATTQIVFMTGINATTHHEFCYSVALVLHYLFLVTCFWLVSYSIHILRKLRNTARYTGKVREYCILSWVLPVALVIVSFVLNPRGYEMKRYCWLTIQRGMLLSFIVPVTGLILINTIVMVLVLKNFNEQISVTHKTEIYKIRTSMRAGVTLLPFFSVNWFFGVLAVEDSSTTAFQVAFALSNSLQGTLIFIFFCLMDSDIRQSFRMRYTKTTKKQKVSAMKLKKSCSFPVRERATLTALTDDIRRLDSTPLLSNNNPYTPVTDDPCCSNIRV